MFIKKETKGSKAFICEGVKVLKMFEWIKYLLYFLSYFFVYLLYPIVIIVQFLIGGDNPNGSQLTTMNIMFYFLAIVFTILVAIVLNILFKEFTGLKRNNKYSWLIFISHIVLIPITFVLVSNTILK
jgi:hypothetical protein